ncbi:MAG: DUF4292 domain-containing protein [Syntrophales bacterium]
MASEPQNKPSQIKDVLTILHFLVIAFLVFSFFGCLSTQAPLLPMNFPSPEDALRGISSKALLKGTFKATARIEIISARGGYPVRAAIMLKRPSFLRLDNIPFIGTPDFFLSVRENVLKVFLPGRGEFYIGQATTRNFSSFLPISLPVEDIISILTGACPFIDERNQTMEGNPEGDLYRINVISMGRIVRSLWLNLKENHLVRVDVYPDNENIFSSAMFEDFSKVEDVDIPQKVIITTGKDENESSITIRYSDIKISAEKDTEKFDLPIPAGVKLIGMD